MEAFLDLLLDRLRDKPRNLLFYLLLGVVLLVWVLGMVDTVFNIYEAFEDRTILWIVGMLGALVIIGASLSVLRESRALHSSRLRLLSISSLALMLLLCALLLWTRLVSVRPDLNRWQPLARWLLVISVVVSLLAVFLYWRTEIKKAADFRVLLTAFSQGATPDTPDDCTLNFLVLEALTDLASEVEGFEVMHLDEVVLDAERARKLGENAAASVVMYGFYSPSASKVFLSICFEVIKEPDYYYPLSIDRQTVDIETLESFTLHVDLANEAAHLTAFLLGMFKYSQEDYASAAEAFSQALALDPRDEETTTDAALHTYLGNTFYYSASLDQAYHEYKTAVKIDPSYAKAWHNLGAVCLLIDHSEDPLAFFDEAIGKDSDLLVSYQGRGTVWLSRREYAKAIQDFSYVLQNEPCNTDVLVLRARSYCLDGEHQLALTDFETALHCDPHLPTAIKAELVQEYCHLNDPRKAITLYQELMEETDDPELTSYFMAAIGVAFEQLGDLASATEAYAKSISPDARDPQKYLERAEKYLDLGETALAIDDYTSAIRLSPNWCTAYYHRARAYAEQEKLDQALADYSSAIDRANDDPTLLDALLFRGQIYCKIHDYQRALEDFDNCLDLGSLDARVYLYRGYALMGLRTFHKAITALEIAKEKNPDSQKAIELLGTAHAALAYTLLKESEGEPTRCQTTRIIHHLICAFENGRELESPEDFACCLDQGMT